MVDMIRNVRTFALTCGLLLGFFLFLLLLLLWLIGNDGSPTVLSVNGNVVFTYTLSPLACLMGLFGGFIDGVIGGAAFVWLHNHVVGRPSTARR
ncbi:MAG: hypothetical protein P8Z76_10580 [Alphaproteobacteria bacterium]|jgi:hypothetical protein